MKNIYLGGSIIALIVFITSTTITFAAQDWNSTRSNKTSKTTSVEPVVVATTTGGFDKLHRLTRGTQNEHIVTDSESEENMDENKRKRPGRTKYADITLNKPVVVSNDSSETDSENAKMMPKSGDANHNTVRSNNTNGIIVKGTGAIKNITRTESDPSRKMDDTDVHEDAGAKKIDKGGELNGNINIAGDVRMVDRNKDGHVTGNITLTKGHQKAVEEIINNVTNDAWEPIKIAEVEDSVNEAEGGEIAVMVERTVKKKLFGIFSVKVKETARATVVGVSEIKRPWWSVFAW